MLTSDMSEALLNILSLIIKNSKKMNHSDNFLVAFGALLCDYAALANCTYAEICDELSISPQTYSGV